MTNSSKILRSAESTAEEKRIAGSVLGKSNSGKPKNFKKITELVGVLKAMHKKMCADDDLRYCMENVAAGAVLNKYLGDGK